MPVMVLVQHGIILKHKAQKCQDKLPHSCDNKNNKTNICHLTKKLFPPGVLAWGGVFNAATPKHLNHFSHHFTTPFFPQRPADLPQIFIVDNFYCLLSGDCR